MARPRDGKSSHGTRGQSPSTSRLPGAVPFSVSALNRLNWEFGSRVVADATLLSRREHRTTNRTLGVYDATDHTVVLGVRTPAGRERFYGVSGDEFDEKRPNLVDADDWRRSG